MHRVYLARLRIDSIRLDSIGEAIWQSHSSVCGCNFVKIALGQNEVLRGWCNQNFYWRNNSEKAANIIKANCNNAMQRYEFYSGSWKKKQGFLMKVVGVCAVI